MTIFYLLDDNTDPLDLIVINKKFRDRLKDNGIDGFEINKILQKRYGLKLDWPLSETNAAKAARKQADYARRWLKDICNYEIITDKESGYIVDINPKAIADAIIDFYDGVNYFLMLFMGSVRKVQSEYVDSCLYKL